MKEQYNPKEARIEENDLSEEAVYLLKWDTPRQAEEADTPVISNDQWVWVEGSVWTAKMLKTLERGVKGGKWYSLIDKVWKIENLRSAFKRVKANKGAAGVDRQAIAQYEEHLESNLQWLSEKLKQGSYRTKPIRRCYLEKPGRKKELRPIGIATVRDRIVQTALRNVIEPILENEFAPRSYGFRPQRHQKLALREICIAFKRGKHWVLDADIQGYFDQIDHKILMGKVAQHISDNRVLELIELFLKAEVDENGTLHASEQGSPQGAVISPLLANLYPNELDWALARQGLTMVRYADDFVVLCDEETQAQQAKEYIEKWCTENQLRLHPDKTQIVQVSTRRGIDFLGYHLRTENKRWVSEKSRKQFRDKLRPLTARCHGQSLKKTIEKLNPILRGYFNYYKDTQGSVLEKLDQLPRRRLRTIIRCNNKRKGNGRGWDNKRYQIVYFNNLGLFNMEQARLENLES
ncbi:group II intron reverse transcriptase/maturase [Rubritalea tangerina]|uniref:Group II intron reverse transcriptase/maturase n=2 Tax=Rubritalea tangerina TaxID=430798 RepID=A0ABW4Z9R5_9BACT